MSWIVGAWCLSSAQLNPVALLPARRKFLQAAITVEQMKRLLDAAATLLDVAPPALPAVLELVEVRGQVLAPRWIA